jgi:hypothetical protein
MMFARRFLGALHFFNVTLVHPFPEPASSVVAHKIEIKKDRHAYRACGSVINKSGFAAPPITSGGPYLPYLNQTKQNKLYAY